MELRIRDKEIKLIGLNMVHDFIIRLFGNSEVRLWIITDQSLAEILNERSKEGATAVRSTISEDVQFNADVRKITKALLENAEGANNH